MTNPLKGEAALKLGDGREFTLVLDFDGLIAAEQAYAKPMAQMMAEAQGGFMGALRAILWGALRQRHGAVSLSEAGQILLDGGDEAFAALTKAIDASMPAKAANGAEGEKPGNAAQPPAGNSSGSNGAGPD